MTLRQPDQPRVTPGLRAVFDRINSRRGQTLASLQQVEEERGGGGGFLGSAFDFVSENVIGKGIVSPISTAAKYGVAALSASNRWVVQPALGAGVFIASSPEERERLKRRYPGIGSGNLLAHQKGMRQVWEKDHTLPGPAKFVAEVGLDPTTWIGLGLWKTGSIKFAEALTPYAYAGGEGSLIARTLGGAVRPFQQAGKVMSLSGRIGAVAEGGVISGETMTSVIDDAVRAGIISDGAYSKQLLVDFASRPGSVRSLQGGLFTRLFTPLQLHKVLGPVDVFTDALWRVPFSVAAPGAEALTAGKGRALVGLTNAFGASSAGRAATALAARFGPASARKLPVAAEGGKLGTYLVQQTPESFSRNAFARFSRIWDRLGEYTAIHPSFDSVSKVIQDIRVSGSAIDDVALGLADTDRTLLKEAVDSLDDDTFRAMLKSDDEDVVMGRVASVVQDRLMKATDFISIPRVKDDELTFANRMWGFTNDFVNFWRPWVTTRNPAFQILNILGNLVERGGSGLVLTADGPLAREMARFGYPKEMVPYMERSLFDVIKDLPPDEVRRVRNISINGKKFGSVIDRVSPQAGVGVEMAGAFENMGFFRRFNRVLSAMTGRADFGAQLHHMSTATSAEALRLLMQAPPESPAAAIKTALSAFRADGRINPALADEVEKALPMILSGNADAVDDIMRRFSYENIRVNDIRATKWYGMMDPQSQVAFESTIDDAINTRNLMPREAILEAIDEAERVATATSGFTNMVKTQRQFMKTTDELMSRTFFDLTPGTFMKAQRDADSRIRSALSASADAVRPYDTEAAKALLGDEGRAITYASSNVDMLVSTSIAEAASEHSLLSMAVMPSYYETSQQWTRMVNQRLKDGYDAVGAYRLAIEANDPTGMREALNKLAAAHGDFKPFVERMAAGDNPLFGEVVTQFGATSRGIWHQYLSSKFMLGDALTTMMGTNNLNPYHVGLAIKNAEQEMFRVGDEAARRIDWANRIADMQGQRGLPVPHINRAEQAAMKAEQASLRQEFEAGVRPFANAAEDKGTQLAYRRVVKDIIQGNPSIPEHAALRQYVEGQMGAAGVEDAATLLGSRLEGIPLTREELFAHESRIQEIIGALRDAPTRSYEQLELDLINNYNQLGRAMATSVQRLFPHNFRTIQRTAFAKMRERAFTAGINEVTDREGVRFMQEHIRKLVTVGEDERVRGAVDAVMSQAGRKGVEHMNHMMANYANSSNIQELMTSIFPFASFQLHLPQYLARTFMKRPGVIFAMNHFAEAAQDNFGGTGGLLFGTGLGQTFVFGPQLRFSYLPIMAGNVYANPDDHPTNQLADIVSAFGFSPGPHVQLAMDAGNKVGEQFGLPQAAPEFREGLFPQWRWLQDITALGTLNQSQGLQVPWIGPSGDVREREVAKELASRTHDALDAARAEAGRDLYPEEVNTIRRYVAQTQTEAARREVAGRDLLVSGVPGLKVHASGIDEIRDNAAVLMTEKGLEGVTPANVAMKFKDLSTIQKQEVLQALPEFEDVLAIPPWQETGQAKTVRQARSAYFTAKDDLFADYTKQQRAADEALARGDIDAQQWREIHTGLSKNRAGGLKALELDPNFKPYLDIEKETPTEPDELAWTQLKQLTPTDVNENGVIDDEDMKAYFETRESFVRRQPGWIQDYIRQREAFHETPVEQQFSQTGNQLDQFLSIPKWVGMSSQESLIAQRVLARAHEFAQLSPGPTNTAQLVMTMPGLTPQERILGLQALQAPANPERYAFWVGNPDLEFFYPDFRPANPAGQVRARPRRRRHRG